MRRYRITREEYYFVSSNYPEIWRENVITGRAENERCPAIIKVLGVNPNERVLEIGTGEGRFIPLITERGALYVGIDISPRMLYYAKRKINLGAAALVNLVVAEAKHLPFRDRAFDKVFCYATIFFIPKQEEVVKEARRVTRRRVLIEFRNALHPRVLRGFLLYSLRKALGKAGKALPYYPLTPKNILRLFDKPVAYFFKGSKGRDLIPWCRGIWSLRACIIIVEDMKLTPIGRPGEAGKPEGVR